MTVGDDVKTLSSATPPQRHKSMQVVCRRARTVASVVVKAVLSRDLDGEVGVNLAGGHADDSNTNVLMRRWSMAWWGTINTMAVSIGL